MQKRLKPFRRLWQYVVSVAEQNAQTDRDSCVAQEEQFKTQRRDNSNNRGLRGCLYRILASKRYRLSSGVFRQQTNFWKPKYNNSLELEVPVSSSIRRL